MSLGLGRGLGELEGRLLSANQVGACCAVSAGEVAVLLVELQRWHHHMVGLALRLYKQRLLPKIGWGGAGCF